MQQPKRPRFHVLHRPTPNPEHMANGITIDDAKTEAAIHISDPDELKQLIAELERAVPFLEETRPYGGSFRAG